MSARASVADLVTRVADELAQAGVPSPRADARWLVVAATGIDPLRMPSASVADAAALERLDAMVARRAGREPLQLVVGTSAFRTIEVVCRPGVFVPRPETEIVAGVAIDAALARRGRRGGSRRVVVVEPCTGTGAIACSIAAEVPGARVVAGDRDPAAVALARENVDRLAAGDRGSGPGAAAASATARAGGGSHGFAPAATVAVVTSDLLDGMDPTLRGRVDVLVANPPYLPAQDRGTWDPEVADHEPDHALVGGSDGHEVVDALLDLATEWLAPGGVVVVEIDARRGADARAAATASGLSGVRIVPDLTGADRAVVAVRPPGD